jgi:uncharacterized membrane protein YdfJ with MMPL/SSD domain
MHRLTKKAWFGPKKLGWGLSITSWQGAVMTLVAVVLVVASILLLQPLVIGIVVAGCVLVAYVAAALLTGDPPGGPKRAQST